MSYVNDAADIGHKIGAKDAAELQRDHQNPTAVMPDKIHHVGDDTGRLMCDAYDQGGAPAAVDVLLAYFNAYNSERLKVGFPPIADHTIRDTLGWAASVRATRPQIDEMRNEFISRQGIKHRPDTYPDDGASDDQ